MRIFVNPNDKCANASCTIPVRFQFGQLYAQNNCDVFDDFTRNNPGRLVRGLWFSVLNRLCEKHSSSGSPSRWYKRRTGEKLSPADCGRLCRCCVPPSMPRGPSQPGQELNDGSRHRPRLLSFKFTVPSVLPNASCNCACKFLPFRAFDCRRENVAFAEFSGVGFCVRSFSQSS